jgi:cobalt/nickel transport system permease protein
MHMADALISPVVGGAMRAATTGLTAYSAKKLKENNVIAGFLVVTAIAGGVFSWFASSNPDGLEWSMKHTSGKEELKAPEKGLHSVLSALQEKTASLPDYSFQKPKTEEAPKGGGSETHGHETEEKPWPSYSAGTSVSGLVGAAATMALVASIGFGLRRFQQRQ